jgi:FAD-dependent oxidoreductase domain-containing protein 1
VIVGGGPVGSSTALHLAWMNPNRRILVIERDSSYKIASASLSAGGIRQQFSLPENVKMCIYGSEFIKDASIRLAVQGRILT